MCICWGCTQGALNLVITQAQIAKLAGVSRGTVDRVINQRGHVDPEVEARIKKIAEELGYERNRAGSMLVRAKRSLRLGVVIQSVATPFMALVLDEIMKAKKEMQKVGVELIVIERETIQLEQQLEDLAALEREGVNGIALTPVEDERILERIDELHANGIPVVTFNTDMPGSKRLCYVGQDNYLSGRACAGLMNMLLSGHGTVLMLSGHFSNLSHRRRIDGFQSEVRSRYPALSLLPLERGNDDRQTCYDCVRRVLNAHDDVRGIYLAANGQAGVCDILRELGYQEKIHFICHDLIDDTLKGLRDGTIDFVIDQNAALQATRPLEVLTNYLLTNEYPAEEYMLTPIDIRTSYNI